MASNGSTINRFPRSARPAGFEPATRCLEGSCSVRLSYGRSKRNCARRRSRDGYTKVAVCRTLTPCHLGKRQAASPRGLPNRRGYLTLPSGIEFLQADQLDQRIACGAIGQLSVEARPAITSESRSRSVAERQHPAGSPRLVGRSGARPPSSWPMTDIADPDNRSRAMDCCPQAERALDQ